MATVAENFPTPCTSTFWAPDCEEIAQVELFTETCSTGSLHGADSLTGSVSPDVGGAGSALKGEAEGGVLEAFESGDNDTSQDLSTSVGDPRTISSEVRRWYEAVSEHILVVKEPRPQAGHCSPRRSVTPSLQKTRLLDEKEQENVEDIRLRSPPAVKDVSKAAETPIRKAFAEKQASPAVFDACSGSREKEERWCEEAAAGEILEVREVGSGRLEGGAL